VKRGCLIKLRALLIERRSVTALEFGLVGPLFVLGIVALFEFGYLFMAQLILDAATQSVARQIQTGQAQNQATSATFNSNVLCPTIIVLDCSRVYANIQIVTDYYSNNGSGFDNGNGTGGFSLAFNNKGVPNNNFCQAEATKLVELDVVYMAPVFLARWLPQISSYNSTPAYAVQAAAAFSTENYPAPSGGLPNAC